MAQPGIVNSILIGTSILECFTSKQRFYTLSEITRAVHSPKTTVFRFLKTLCKLDYLEYNAENKKYSLGPRNLLLGTAFLESLEIRDIVRPFLKKLSCECNKSINLTMLKKTEMVYIDKIKVDDLRDLNINIGDRIPVYNTAAGKAVLAHLDPGRLFEIIKEIKTDLKISQSIGRKAGKLLSALDEVRTKGFAIGDQEFRKGIRSIAVPILSPQGANYSIGMVVASELVSIKELVREYAPKFIETGREASKAAGFYEVARPQEANTDLN